MSNLIFLMDFSELVGFYKTLHEIGGMQQKYVVQAAKKGQEVVLAEVKRRAPVGKTGNLSSNIISVGERKRRDGKKVYDTTFKGGDEANRVLGKPIKRPGIAGGQNKKAYYPASMEYGFLTRANQGGGLKYVSRKTGIGLKRYEGKHFMKKAAEAVEPKAEEVMINTLMKRIEKEWKKKQKT